MLCVGAMCWRRRRSSTKKRTRFDSPSGHNERHGQSDSDDKVNAKRELDGSVVSIPTCDDHSIVDGNSVGSNTHHHPEKLNVSCCRCIRFKWRGTTTQRTQRKKKHRSSSRSRRSRRHTDDAEGDKHGSAIEPQQAVDTVDVYQPRYASLDPPDGSWDDIPDPSDSAMIGQSPPQHLFQYDTGAGDEAYWRAVSRASPQQPIRFDVPQHRAWQTGRHTAVTPQPLHNSNQWPARPSSAQGQLQGQANGFRRVTVDEMKRMIAARPVRMKALAPQLAPQPPQMSSVMTAPIVVRSQGDGDQPGQLFHLVPVQPASSHSHHSHMMPPGPVSITGDREYSEDTLIDTIPSPTFPDDGSTAMTVREYQVRSPAIARSILSGTPILARGKRRTIRRLTRNGRNSRARSRIASVATAEASRVMMDEDPGVGEAHLGGLFPDSMDQIERDVMVAKSAIRLFKKKLRAKRRMRYATSAPALTLPGYGGSP